ncbi:MAG: nucleoid-associated protein [Bacteroidetes bacterium]|nr:nucleoid-associated protein [Bacteroidota bacterium]
MINFAHSEFNRIIIHSILKKEKDEEHSRVVLDNNLVIADDEVHRTIKERINKACGKRSKSFKLQIEQSGENSFFNLASSLFESDDNHFVELSQSIASKLAVSQTRSNIPGGYLIVIEGISMDEDRFVLVIKAELHNAFSTSIDEVTGRKQIELLREIFLSPSEKFFKIGLLNEGGIEEEYPNDRYEALIYDEQFNSSSARQPADYFYREFLGFTLDRNDKILTKGFFNETSDLIRNSDADPSDKKDCLDALRSVYNDQQEIVDPVDFGGRFLPENLRDTYEENILIQPKYQRQFGKDKSLLGRTLANKKLTFRGKITVQAPAETFDENIKIIRNEAEARAELDNPQKTVLSISGHPYEE